MKISIILFCSALVLAESCASSKSPEDDLYGPTWELEYMSGPRISFDGLFPNKKPQLTFEKESGMVSGTDSCNGYSTDITLEGNSISFGEPGPTTMMFCGGSERQFLQMMKKKHYTIKKLWVLFDFPILTYHKTCNCFLN